LDDEIILQFLLLFLPLLPFMCGNANNIWELVAFRFIQGLVVVLPTAQTITESYPVAKRGMAQAIYGMGGL
jgi:DHA2 family multidrug resistance protein